MIRHILKKDWRQLWKFVVGVSFLGLIEHVVLFRAGVFDSGRNGELTPVLILLTTCSIAILIVLLVQQDAIPGLRQDWLVRPIRRRDLLLSKLLFVALIVQAPLFLMEVAQGLAAGFPFSQSLGSALSRSLWMLFAFDFPILAFATLTANFRDAIVAALVLAVGLVVVLYLFDVLISGLLRVGGIDWVTDSAQLPVGALGAAVVLALQYFARRTLRARWVYACALVVWVSAQFIPWGVALAVQERFSGNRAAADAVQITFHPDDPPFKAPPGSRIKGDGVGVIVHIPLRVTGEHYGKRRVDRVLTRVFTSDGHASRLVTAPPFDPGSRDETFQIISLSDAVLSSLRDQRVRLELDYAITLLKVVGKPTMPALTRNQRGEFVPGVGRCSTRLNPEVTTLELGCINPGVPSCYSWFLADFENDLCRADYAPWFGRIDGDSMNRTGSTTGLENLVDPEALKDDQIRFVVYQTEAHLSRHVVIPDIRLGDWVTKYD